MSISAWDNPGSAKLFKTLSLSSSLKLSKSTSVISPFSSSHWSLDGSSIPFSFKNVCRKSLTVSVCLSSGSVLSLGSSTGSVSCVCELTKSFKRGSSVGSSGFNSPGLFFGFFDF